MYALQALSAEEVATVLRARGAGDADRGRATTRSTFLAARSEGDARTALNALELAADDGRRAGRASASALARVEDALQRRAVLYDKGGDRHYDYISAWIKATRGSDPDASLYYLAVMLEGGEDPRFIVRRMVILASEDIGNADPEALSVATAAAAGGRARRPARGALRARPGGHLPGARAEVRRRRAGAGGGRSATCASTAPRRCRRGCARGRARGRTSGGYDNPHPSPGTSRSQELLPESVAGARFYEPDEAEAELAERLARDSPGARRASSDNRLPR